jgi:hypothetical protein
MIEAVRSFWVRRRDVFEQPVLGIQDEVSFDVVRGAIESAFAPESAPSFLKRVERQRLRVRDFEGVLRKGLLGSAAGAACGKLGDADRGQIRELYLASVEHVAPELRARFLKVYAYY